MLIGVALAVLGIVAVPAASAAVSPDVYRGFGPGADLHGTGFYDGIICHNDPVNRYDYLGLETQYFVVLPPEVIAQLWGEHVNEEIGAYNQAPGASLEQIAKIFHGNTALAQPYFMTGTLEKSKAQWQNAAFDRGSLEWASVPIYESFPAFIDGELTRVEGDKLSTIYIVPFRERFSDPLPLYLAATDTKEERNELITASIQRNMYVKTLEVSAPVILSGTGLINGRMLNFSGSSGVSAWQTLKSTKSAVDVLKTPVQPQTGILVPNGFKVTNGSGQILRPSLHAWENRGVIALRWHRSHPPLRSSTHGNSSTSNRPAIYYQLWRGDQFLKHGIYQIRPGYRRYTDAELEYGNIELRPLHVGPRSQMLQYERYWDERFPGPWNLERHAGTQAGFEPWQWRNLNTQLLLETK